jgi:hypothetical protein
MLNGGAGSKLDRWGMYNNQENYPEIQKSFDHYCYSIVDIDIANKFFEVTTYSLGHLENPLDNVVIDHFIRNKEDETPPADPSFVTPLEDDFVEFPFILQASEYAGTYEIMSSQFQVTNNKGVYDKPLLNILRDFEDIYGVTQAPDYFAVDLNQGIDLTKVVVPELNVNGDIWARVRYRDKNLQWSSWSPELDLVIVDPTNLEEEESVVVKEYKLHNNYPNPFNPSTSIRFDIVETSIVTLKVYNSLGQFITELENGKLAAGRYVRSFDISNLSSGVYFYKLTANNFSAIGKMNLLK